MKERLQQLLTREGLTPVKFSEIVGVQRSAVSHILSGRNNPSLDFIQKILNNFPKISSDWLITGNGEMYRSNSQSPTKTEEPADLFNSIRDEPPATYVTSKKNIEPLVSNNSNKTLPVQDEILPTTEIKVEKIVVFYTNGTFKDYQPHQ